MLGFVPQPNLQTSLYPINLYKKMRISSVLSLLRKVVETYINFSG